MVEIDSTIPPIKKPRKKREKPVDKQLVTAMLANGYQKKYISEVADCSEVTVHSINNIVKNSQNEIKSFLSDRANLLAYYQKQHLELISKLNESIAKDLEDGLLKGSEKGKILFYLSQGFGIFYDKERLETGKSSSNVSIMQSFMIQAHEKV